MSLRFFLNLFTATALLGGLAFWPAACASQRLFSQARSGAHASQTGQSAAGLTLWKDRGSERSSVSFNHDQVCINGGRGLGEARLVSAQGLERHGDTGTRPPVHVGPGGGLRTSHLYRPASPQVKDGRALRTLATNAAHLCGVPVRLFHSLIARESSWNPRARSSSGALGLGQLMPAAAKEMGVEDRLDPWQNVLGAACFLRKQYDRAGSWRKALLSYHAGPNRVRTSQATHDYATDIIEASN